ncbi:MAG: cupin domain-containing protein [Acidihalobacter sp.]|uniref:JmjC domain-containing protein n=1 Tax=Acidihalobacter sp. TaxID=1872108 RepID=UPI00307D616A
MPRSRKPTRWLYDNEGFHHPPGKPGYNVHFDALDTFVLQLDGEKHWKVFPQAISMPTATQARELEDEEVGEALAEYTLEPGDLLYMPAGYPHGALCVEEHSTHVTIGFTPWRVNRIAEFVINTLLAPTSETIRQHLLAREADEDSEAKLKIGLLDIASALEHINPRTVMDTFQNASRGIMPSVLDYGIKNASSQPLLTVTSTFSFNSESLHRLDLDLDAGVVFVRLGCSMAPRPDTLTLPPHMELPAYAACDLEWIFDCQEPFSVADIRGDLDEESRLVLLKELVNHGVVNVVSA